MPGRKGWIGLVALVLGGPLATCAGCGVAGLFLDEAVELGVEERLQAPPAPVYDLLDDAEGIARWWAVAMEQYAREQGTEMALEVVHRGGPPAGVGCQVDFVAGGVATETWTILELVPQERVVYDVDFKMMRVERTLLLQPDGEGTRVRWTETGTLSNPWLRVMAAVAGGAEGARENFRGALRALDLAARPAP